MARIQIDRDHLRQERLDWILESTFLCQLDRREQDQLLQAAEWHLHQPDQIIIAQGVAAPGVDLLVEGQAMVRVRATDGEEARPRRLGPGHVVGERSLLRDAPTRGEVRALSPVRSLHLSPDAFRALLAQVPRLRVFIEDLVALREQSDAILELLLRNPFFRLLSRDDLELFIQSGVIHRLDAGRRLVSAGERGKEVYLLLRGKLAVYAPGGVPGASRELLADEGPGWLFGHAAVLLDTPRTADVETLEASELLLVPARAFMEIVSQNPSLQRRLYQELAMLDLRADAVRAASERPLVVAVFGTRGDLGTTTLAYGVAAGLAAGCETVLVDLAGEKTAQRLGMPVEDRLEGQLPVRRLKAPPSWKLEVLWPGDRAHAEQLIEQLRARGAAGARVVVAADRRDPADAAAVAACDAVVLVRPASDPLHADAMRHGQFRIEAVRLDPDRDLFLHTSPNAVRVAGDATTAAAFWRSGDLALLSGESSPLGRACGRLVRVLQGRSVGLALGGGGALGFAHIGLIRALRAADIPIDYVAGSSFGALVAGIYAAGGEAALGELIKHRYQLLTAVAAGMVSTATVALFVDRLLGRRYLSSTEIPFFPVAMDLSTGREVVLARGTIGQGVRSSSCLPGPFPAWHLGSWRLVDGGLVNNVPASVTWDAGAHFIVASNIIPSLRAAGPTSAGLHPDRNPLRRFEDLFRSMHLLMAQAGRDRASLADYVFDLQPMGYQFYDFAKGDVIADAGRRQAERQITDIVAAYRNDNSARIGQRQPAVIARTARNGSK